MELGKTNVSLIVGLLLFVYAKESMRTRISKVEFDKLNLGFMQFANKGAVSVKLNIDDT